MSSDHYDHRWQHLYNSARWKKGRARHLKLHPLCVMCAKRGVVRAATIVDHREPHRGDVVLFFDEENWQSLCKVDHDSAKQRQEVNGHLPGADVDGVPLDPSHHWRAQ